MTLRDGGASGGTERSTAEDDENSSFEDDDEDYEEGEGGNRLFGFMFGNVDDSGDLDADYLDEDAKDHLGALADKLGPSLAGIDLSEKSPHTSEAADQDYRKKAEDAIDYEDIDEEYDGPEVEAATEEDFVAEKVLITSAENRTSVFDDENYDEEDDDLEKQNLVVEATVKDEKNYAQEAISQEVIHPENNVMLEMENSDGEESEEDDSNASDDSMSDDMSSLLPVLYEEDGKAILKFSEIFGIREPIKRAEKRESRYVISREKYKSMNPSDVVEEDEGGYLEVPSKDVSWMRLFRSRSDVDMLSDENEMKSVAIMESGTLLSLEAGDSRKDTCVLAEPMKADVPLDTLPKQILHFSDQLCPLDQENWEDRILWNNSPSVSDKFVETCELSGPDSDIIADDNVGDVKPEPQKFEPELQIEPHDNDHASFLNSCSILVEPFGSNKYSEDNIDLPTYEDRSNPQLLRLESNMESGGVNDVSSEVKLCSDAMRRFSQLTLQNRDVLDGTWLDGIVWEPGQPVAKPKLILDLQDDQMLFEVSDTEDDRLLQLHAGAMILARSLLKGSGSSPVQQHGHGISSAAKFNISNDKFYSNRKSSQQLRSHSKKRSIHGLKILHSVPALKLQTMKAKLSNKDIANFHRPKAIWYPHDIEVPFKEQGKFASGGQMKIIIKSLGGKGTKLHVDAEETVSSTKTKASKKLDFKLSEPVKIFYSGRELEDWKTLAEQDVLPNTVLHLIRTKIHLLPRAQKLPGENKSLRPPGAFKKKSDLSVKDGHVFLMEYCEERPLLLGNPGMGARLCTYYQKSAPNDQKGNLMRNANNGFGSIVVLDPADKSPFLGDIKPGSSQSGLETNMYRAPIFQHKVPPTDYLLVRSAKGKLSIRRIDRIDVVGQQEPHTEVMAPGSKAVQFYIMNRLLVYMYREFSACEKRGVRPSIRVDELFSQFPNISEAFLRKRLKNCADIQRERSGQYLWVMKRNFRIPSEEELRRMVTPENVCAYESMQAGLYRLKRLGITSLTHPTGLSSAMNQLPDEAITLAAASHIERELLITPWSLSSNFVSCTNQDRENIERLEITGVGDPSGRGLGFSYVRATPKASVANPVAKKKTVVAKGTTVTGTDADLRRLSMEAARELLLKFNVPEEQIAKLTRWHRIALIRKLSSEQAASGATVDPTTVSKFARGQRMSFLQLQQQTREKCQEVWDRQIQSLYSGDGEENESEAEANSDLDSFAGDLENLLDAEEFEEGEEVNHESKPGSIDGVKGLKMRRHMYQTLTDEEIEDEAAEAAELCRILMEDDETDRKKKKKANAVIEKIGPSFKPKHDPQNAERIKSPTPKRIAEVPFVPQLNISMDHKEADGLMTPRNNLMGKLKPKKKKESEQTGLLNKKIKILGDGMTVIKEKKSARDSFVCGACGQLGHMRTNKNCPKYGEDSEARIEAIDSEKLLVRPNFSDQAEQGQQRPFPKKLNMNGLKIPGSESAMEDDNMTTPKAKFLKVKCGGSTDMPHDKLTSPDSLGSDRPFMTTDTEIGNKLNVKVNKITFSNKMRPEDGLSELHRPSIVIKPPVDTDRDQPPKKIVFKQSKELYNVDDNSQDGSFGFDFRKMKTMNELSGSDAHFELESRFEDDWSGSGMRNPGGGSQWWASGTRTSVVRRREERNRKVEQARMFEPQQAFELPRYEDFHREREEEERQRAKAKKKKKRKPETKDDYLDDFPPRRNDRSLAERERTTRVRPEPSYVKHSPEFSHAPKRRRGGEVGLSNTLETIVDTLRNRKEISYLFLKPVTRKEAPDYLSIISHPMDLATIRDKVRRMEYKNRHEFRHDVYQIVFNAHTYNDNRNPGIPPLADQLLELCDYLLDQYDRDLAEAEAGIE